jgi:bifunctional non-homologous end joining protein LigD
VKSFAQGIAEAMAKERPDRFTRGHGQARQDRPNLLGLSPQRTRCDRGGGLLDPSTTGAPVSTPLGWDELSPSIRPDHFTVYNLPTRLRHLAGDPWVEICHVEQVLPSTEGRKRRPKQ